MPTVHSQNNELIDDLVAVQTRRYSDFLVNEIDSNGNAVQLNSVAVTTSEPAARQPHNTDAAPEPSKSQSAHAKLQETPDGPTNTTRPIQVMELLSGLDKFLSPEDIATVHQFFAEVDAYERSWVESNAASTVDNSTNSPSSNQRLKPPQPISFTVSSNKDMRTAVHQFFKRPVLPKCSTETLPHEDGGQHRIQLCYHAQVGSLLPDCSSQPPAPIILLVLNLRAFKKQFISSCARAELLPRQMWCLESRGGSGNGRRQAAAAAAART